MTRVLGIDPGSSATGWALVVGDGPRVTLEEAGVLRPARGRSRERRLADLSRLVDELLERLGPECAAVESGFSGRNPRSGLQLAESRGAILAVVGRRELDCHPYSPAEVKSAVVGHGTAEKAQVGFMVVRLLGLSNPLAADAADAAAVALTHLRAARWKARTGRLPGAP